MVKKFSIVFIFMLVVFSLFGVKALAVLDCSDSSFAKSHESYCRSELQKIEDQYALLVKQLANQNKQSSNYASEVKKLTLQIDALKAKIKARGLVIAQLKNNISKKVNTISSLSEKIENEHQSLAQLLRNINQLDSKDIVYLILSDENFIDFYGDFESYTSIQKAVKTSVEKITGIKIDTEEQKKSLETEQDKELDAKAELENAQKKVAQSEADKKKLLAASKDKESAFKLLATQKKAKADQIRAALFKLRDSAAIPFGTALEYAKLAQKHTGVPPAFLLAIITQESNLGTDSGSCYVTNFETGDGVSSKSGKVFKNVMKPSRDIGPFKSITKSVGRDPAKTLVSCPIGGYGYGGAMGPAQFIPSTWVGMKNKVATALGISNPDPWEPKDALMASALFLSELGAGSSYTSEIKAACAYYSGKASTTCSYGKQVMARVSKIQENIDLISGD